LIGQTLTGEKGIMASFTVAEVLKGYVTPGETDPFTGYRKGLLAGLTAQAVVNLTVDDVKRFVQQPDHSARAAGTFRCPALGGDLPYAEGVFHLFVEEDNPYLRRMIYRLFATGPQGRVTVSGFKTLSDNPSTGIWFDCGWLWTRIFPGHITPEQEETTQPIAAGVLFLFQWDFFRWDVLTFKFRGPEYFRELLRFSRFFLGTMIKFLFMKRFGHK
jgi:cholesterol oxidase